MEIEAKYTVSDPAIFDTLHNLRALGAYALRPTGEQHLTDHYLDTLNRDLLRGGYACRLREDEADRHWVLTVKSLGRADGVVHRRQEHQCEVPPSTAPTEWPEGPAREIVIRLSAGRPLRELFTLHQHRVRRAVEHGERPIGELSLDTVEVDMAGRQVLIREMEIELSASGTVDDLHAIDAGLRPLDLTPQPTSKFERALALLDSTDAVPAPKKKRKVFGVRADQPLAEAGRKILRFHFERMLENEGGTRKGDDVEALHHMRVATRRQRAAIRIVAPYFKRKALSGFRDELRTLADRLGAVRDLDVLIDEVDRYRASLSGAGPAALEPLVEEWRAQRDDARDELLGYLDGDDYRTFTERYGEFLATAGAGVKDAPEGSPQPHLVRHVLPMEIWDHYGRVRAYETVMEWASIETFHALRIQAKRLRYLLEFFSEALGPGLSEVIEALVALQDHIGELHDVDVTIGLLRDFLMRSAQASVNPSAAAAVGRYLKLKQASFRTLQRTLKRPWKRVAGKRLRSVLGRAVARL